MGESVDKMATGSVAKKVDLAPIAEIAPYFRKILRYADQQAEGLLSKLDVAKALLYLYMVDVRPFCDELRTLPEHLDDARILTCLKHAGHLTYQPLGKKREPISITPFVSRAFRGLFKLAPQEKLDLQSRLLERKHSDEAWAFARVVTLMVMAINDSKI